jgi:hypothetical protein
MEINVKWWSIIAVVVISLLAILIIDGNTQLKNIEGCKTIRIRPFPQQFFNWTGIVELTNKGAYQPSCL